MGTTPVTSSINPKTCFSPLKRLVLLAVLLLGFFGCQPIGGAKNMAAPSAGEIIFKIKCSKCHDLDRAMDKYRSKELWFTTITMMRDQYHAEISQDELAQLVSYHLARQQEEAKLFTEKCRNCHLDKIIFGKRLDKDQIRAVILRMQQKAGNTIEDRDIEILVRYHVQTQQLELEKHLREIYSQVISGRPDLQSGVTLFLEKCSACHRPSRALAVTKDPEVWQQTIRRMQSYSKGAIGDTEAKDLVGFHITVQQKEISTFKETCTKCHDDARINSRSLSEEEWLQTIRRMQLKAPELITDEKVNLLSAYFHRRELTMARIFSGKCNTCHLDNSKITRSNTVPEMDGLIALANAEVGEGLDLTDVKVLLDAHVERQKRSMALYESNCGNCHPDGNPKKKRADQKSKGPLSRNDWLSFIAELQDQELTDYVQKTINSQIDFHIAQQ